MSNDMKVSLYVTVLDEEHTIDGLYRSIKSQTRQPDECIFIDGGSRDQTLERIRRFQESDPSIRLIEYPDSNIAEARNKGFSSSSFDLVASIDAGCRAEDDWLLKLLEKMTPDVDVVSGVYLPDPKTRFERCVGELMFPRIASLPEYWSNPSHRSALIRKQVWQALGGFPPYLDRSEDTWFNIEAARRGFRFRLARDAVVHWRPRQNLVEVFRNSFRWTRSDVGYRVGSGSWARRPLVAMSAGVLMIPGWFAALATMAFSPILGSLGLLLLTTLMIRPFRTIRFYKSDKDVRDKFIKNLIALTNSIAFVLGFFAGVLARIKATGSSGRSG